MLNKQQKEFRKQMKQVEKEKRKKGMEEPYSYQNENYRPRTYRKNPVFVTGGAIGILVLTWNIYATSTWIAPGYVPTPPVGGIPVESLDTSEEKIHFYITKIDNVQKEIETYIHTLSTMQLETITVAELEEMKQGLVIQKNEVLTDDKRLKEMQDYYLEQTSLLESVISEYIGFKSDKDVGHILRVQEFQTQYNQNLPKRQQIFVSILQKEGMKFEIRENGQVYYEYENSILK